MFYVWFIIAFILGVIEVLTTNLVSIWFVISALLSMLVSMFTDSLWIQFGVFVIVGVALIPLSKKIYNDDNILSFSMKWKQPPFRRLLGA